MREKEKRDEMTAQLNEFRVQMTSVFTQLIMTKNITIVYLSSRSRAPSSSASSAFLILFDKREEKKNEQVAIS